MTSRKKPTPSRRNQTGSASPRPRSKTERPGQPLPLNSWLPQLETICSTRWTAIEKAIAESDEKRRSIESALKRDRLGGPDVGIVVFGSLGRGEWTSGSDVDWTIIVDGRAAPEHRQLAHDFRSLVDRLGLNQPNATGAFGDLTFSHELVHQIGGDADSNPNLTQRMLLLLESRSLGTEFGHECLETFCSDISKTTSRT